MRLTIEPTVKLFTLRLLQQKNIPCHFRVFEDKFEFHFQIPLPDIHVKINDWCLERIEERCPSKVGGEDLFYFASQVSLNKINDFEYEVTDFMFFDYFDGWTYLIQNSQYTELKRWRNDEEMEWELALFKQTENSKKSKKLRAALERLQATPPTE